MAGGGTSLNIYSNDGAVYLASITLYSSTIIYISSTGITPRDHLSGDYTHTGSKPFVGITNVRNGTTPIYGIGDSFVPGIENQTWYIVEETTHGTSKILIDGVGIDLTADTVAANKMLNGIKAHDANGDVVTGNIPSKAAQTYTPGTSAQTIGAGQYLSGAQTIQGDANLAAANIASGKTIFGVPGTHAGQKPEQSKTLTLGAAAPATVTPDSGKVLSSVPVVLDTSVIKAENIAKDVTMLGITGKHEGGGGGGTCILTLADTIYEATATQPMMVFIDYNGTVFPAGSNRNIPSGQYTIAKNSCVVVHGTIQESYALTGGINFAKNVPGTAYTVYFITGDATVYFSCDICCFSENTLVIMSDGTAKSIKDIHDGEIVKSFNATTGLVEDVKVIRTLTNRNAANIAKITLSDDTVLEFNEYHPFMTQDGYKSLTEFEGMPKLNGQDKLVALDGSLVSINKIECYSVDESPALYNIYTESGNFFISNGGVSVLVHDGHENKKT